MQSTAITVVSGLPRSGTSLMMQMLEAGGLPIFTDNVRTADPDNPKGYYEFERTKQLERDQSWVPSAAGKVVKIVSPLLRHLPAEHAYKIVFMQRDLAEVLASQRQMLVRRGRPAPDDDDGMATAFRRHLADVEAWLARQPNIKVLYVPYKAVIDQPAAQIERVNAFLGGTLNTVAMAGAIDQTLHRQRRS